MLRLLRIDDENYWEESPIGLLYSPLSERNVGKSMTIDVLAKAQGIESCKHPTMLAGGDQNQTGTSVADGRVLRFTYKKGNFTREDKEKVNDGVKAIAAQHTFYSTLGLPPKTSQLLNVIIEQELSSQGKELNVMEELERNILAKINKQGENKNDGRPRGASRPRDVNKIQKAKPQDKTENEGRQQNMNKRHPVELDVQSTSGFLFDQTPLGVDIAETSKARSGNASMVNIKTEDGNRRQPDSDRRQRDDDRRQQNDSQQSNTEKHHRDGDRRNVEREKREPVDDKQQQTADRRRREHPESRFYDSANERNTKERDTGDDRPYKGSVRLPFGPQTSGEPLGRAEKFRDKTKNRGGFGVPPQPKEQPKKNENEEKSKDESNSAKTKPISSITELKRSDESVVDSFKGKASESAFVPHRTEWDVADSRDTIAKKVKTEDTFAPTQKTAAEVKTEKPSSTESFRGYKKPTEKEVVEKPTDGKKQQNNKEDKVPTTAPTKNDQYESKTGERRERTVPNKEREQQNFSKSDSGDTKVEKRRETEIYGDGRHRQDDRQPRPRDETRREQPKRNDERKAPVKSSTENWDSEINSRAENRDATRQSYRTQDHTDRRNNSYSRDRKDQRDQRDQDKPDQRNRNERERTDRRDRTDQRERMDRRDRTEQREGNDRRENKDRRDRTEQSERQDRRDRTGQRERIDRRDRTEQRDRTDRRDEIKPVSNEKLESNVKKPRKPGVKGEEQNKDIQQNESLPQKQDANRESERTEKQEEYLSSMKKQSDRFTVGTLSPAGDRRRYNETRRGDASSRRGSHGGTRGMRGRGRVISSGKPIGKASAASKNDNENDSEDFHSVHSSADSDESDSEEVFDKQDDGRRDDKRPTRSYYSSSRSRGSYSSRGRGRGSSQITRSPRKQSEKPPRFQRQEARSASRGRGKSNRGGFSSKDNWDENISKNRDSRNSDEGPLPEKRPPDTSYSNEKDSDGSYRGRKAVRGGHSGNKNFFSRK
ncbi:Hypothetical predicted protein [Paramuricea clavata]|uniref:Uncharacterized protein n=1 Tax=Paramuricea clavata TaxID=317549 RepID=A0A6S7HBU9_PARCT|nr:Hypothetical predicted protein [Paramuricea clavata]